MISTGGYCHGADERSLEISITVAPDLRLPVLLEDVDPLMRRLRREGRIRFWTFTLLPELSLYLGAPRGKSVDDAWSTLQSDLEIAIARHGAKASRFETSWPEERTQAYVHQRFGGALGVRLVPLFIRRTSALVLDLVKESARLGQPAPPASLTIGTVLWLREALELSADDFFVALDAWIDYLAERTASKGQGSELVATLRESAREALRNDTELGEGIARVLEDGFEASPGFGPHELFVRHERAVRRLGRVIASARDRFEGRTWIEVFFHSMLHTLMISAQVNATRELFALTVLAESRSQS
jgi:hypothetical protein